MRRTKIPAKMELTELYPVREQDSMAFVRIYDRNGKWSLPHLMKGQSFVYFLMDNDQVVYIGSSINVVLRVQTHYQDRIFGTAFFPGKIFDKALIYAAVEFSYQNIEKEYIHKFQPKYNVQHNPNPGDDIDPVLRKAINGILMNNEIG